MASEPGGHDDLRHGKTGVAQRTDVGDLFAAERCALRKSAQSLEPRVGQRRRPSTPGQLGGRTAQPIDQPPVAADDRTILRVGPADADHLALERRQ